MHSRLYILVLLLYCRLRGRHLIWLQTDKLEKTRWLLIARPSQDPFKEELRPYVFLPVGSRIIKLYLNEDGTVSQRVREETGYGWKDYTDRWMHVDDKKKVYYTLRNG